MQSLFLWEIGPSWVYLIWLAVFAAQVAIAEINRRWNWTVFVFWTVGGVALMPYAALHGTPMVGWFPFGKYVIMVATATMTGALLVYGKRHPLRARRYAIWLGVALWLGLAVNIMEANIRDVTIYLNTQQCNSCAADWQCLEGINKARTIDMISGLPETRGVMAPLHSQEWYQAVASNFKASGVGIDPATGFRTIGGVWNLMSAAAGLLNIITITGLGKVFVTSNPKRKVKGLIWIDMVWPWIIAYDLWNHAFLYNALADYTWYCSPALLLACTIPALTWAKGQWIWFRCFTLMFWIAMNNWLPELLVPPTPTNNFATMNPAANLVCAGLALASNAALFAYWLYKILKHRRNPLTNALFFELAAFKKVARAHCDDRDKYFLCDMISETPTELGFEPFSAVPPADGYVGHMPWWGKRDRRYPKLRTPLSSDPYLLKKGIVSQPEWDVDPVHMAPSLTTEPRKPPTTEVMQ